MQAGGRLAMNRSLSYDSPHLLMSNLEPRHTYYIQVAAFTSRGTGPFSETLEVRPEPSLAHLGKFSQSTLLEIRNAYVRKCLWKKLILL